MSLILSHTNYSSSAPTSVSASGHYMSRLSSSLKNNDLFETPYLFAIAVITAANLGPTSISTQNGLLTPIQTAIEGLEESPFKEMAAKIFKQWVYRGLGENHLNLIQKGMDNSSSSYYNSDYQPRLEQALKNRDKGALPTFDEIKKTWPSFRDVYNELTKPMTIGTSECLTSDYHKENFPNETFNFSHLESPTLTGKKRKRSDSEALNSKESPPRKMSKKQSASRGLSSTKSPLKERDPNNTTF